jgi:uncharacterized lipoprotein YmbA
MKRRAVALTMLLAGCSPLAPRPDSSSYYVLESSSVPDPPPHARAAAVIVAVGPVVLPLYLARPELATRLGPNQITYSPMARWAEPLQSAVTRALTDALAADLGEGRVFPFPSFGAARLDYGVEVQFRRFECGRDGAATLAAVWTIRDARSRAVFVSRETTVSEPATASDTAGGVAALGRALGVVARDIADEVRRASGHPAPARAREPESRI